MFARILFLHFHFCSGNTTNHNETNLDDIILTQSRALEAATFLLANQNRMETQLRTLEEKLNQMEGKETEAKEEGTISVKIAEPVAEFGKMQKTLEEIKAQMYINTHQTAKKVGFALNSGCSSDTDKPFKEADAMKVLYFLSTGIRKVNFRFTNEDAQVEGFGWSLKYSDKVLKLKNSDGTVRIIAVCDHHYIPSMRYNFSTCTESDAYCEETATDENGYQVLRLNSNFDKSKYKYGARHYYTFNVEIL